MKLILFQRIYYSQLLSLLTAQTLISPSLNPANNFFPNGFQVNEIHYKCFETFYFSDFFGTSTSKVANGLLEVLIKSQTLIPFSVPTATHYNFGLNEIVLMVLPASNDLDG